MVGDHALNGFSPVGGKAGRDPPVSSKLRPTSLRCSYKQRRTSKLSVCACPAIQDVAVEVEATTIKLLRWPFEAGPHICRVDPSRFCACPNVQRLWLCNVVHVNTRFVRTSRCVALEATVERNAHSCIFPSALARQDVGSNATVTSFVTTSGEAGTEGLAEDGSRHIRHSPFAKKIGNAHT